MLKFLKKKSEPKVAETPEPKPTITWKQIEKEARAHGVYLIGSEREVATKILKEKGLLIHKDQLKREDDHPYSKENIKKQISEAIDRIVEGKATSLQDDTIKQNNINIEQALDETHTRFQTMGESMGYKFPEGPPNYPTMVRILSERVIDLMARIKKLEKESKKGDIYRD